jgi:hypothetical protein
MRGGIPSEPCAGHCADCIRKGPRDAAPIAVILEPSPRASLLLVSSRPLSFGTPTLGTGYCGVAPEGVGMGFWSGGSDALGPSLAIDTATR